MPTWLIFAALGAIAITAVLVGLLYAVNLPNYGPEQRTGDGDGAGGE